jgi:hypothetical protein
MLAFPALTFSLDRRPFGAESPRIWGGNRRANT